MKQEQYTPNNPYVTFRALTETEERGSTIGDALADLARAKTRNEDTDTDFQPFIGEGYIGYRVTFKDGTVRYIYLNPSTGCDEGPPDVFVYLGEVGEPGMDTPECFINLE